MRDFAQLIDDVSTGRREIKDFVREIGGGELRVLLDNDEEVAVTRAEARELSAARHHGGSNGSLDGLFDSLFG